MPKWNRAAIANRDLKTEDIITLLLLDKSLCYFHSYKRAIQIIPETLKNAGSAPPLSAVMLPQKMASTGALRWVRGQGQEGAGIVTDLNAEIG
jgi:hypothetical protein